MYATYSQTDVRRQQWLKWLRLCPPPLRFEPLQSGADPEISLGGHEAPPAQRGWGVGRGVPPSPPGKWSGEGAVPPPQTIFSILNYKMTCFGRFWCATCTVDRCCQIGNVHVKCEMSMCRWSVTGTKTCRVIIINMAHPQTHPHRGGVWLCPLHRNFFKYCIIKWPVLVDSDVLHVLLTVVDRCYQYVGGFMTDSDWRLM